jgi:hypothetical protein
MWEFFGTFAGPHCHGGCLNRRSSHSVSIGESRGDPADLTIVYSFHFGV